MFNITFKNQSPANFNAWLGTIPVITPSSTNQTRQNVPALDGDLLVDDASQSDAYCDFTIHAKRDDLVAKMRDLRKWLQGTGRLVISNATDAYYEVKRVSFTQFLFQTEKYGRLSVQMELYPYEFLNSGDLEISSYSTIVNPADVCKPLYKITGNGEGTLTINNYAVSFNVAGTLYIDTRRHITSDGSGNDADARINGDYKKMYLQPGNNSISCTVGTLKVTPHWGYKI